MTYTTQVNQVPPIQEQVEKTIDEVSEKEDQVSLTVVSNKKEQTLCGASKFVVYSYFLVGGGCESLGFLRCWSCPKKLCSNHAPPHECRSSYFVVLRTSPRKWILSVSLIKCLKRSLRWQPARLRCSGSSSGISKTS